VGESFALAAIETSKRVAHPFLQGSFMQRRRRSDRFPGSSMSRVGKQDRDYYSILDKAKDLWVAGA
jgi:hypothetical protein